MSRPTAVFNGRTFDLHHVTGKVLDTNTRAETEVHGSGGGGGGFSYQGTGASSSAPIRITSTTTRYTKIFLLDREQREHALQLVNFDVHCRAGNGLSVVWAIQVGKGEGPYIVAYNHSTREMEFNVEALAKLCTPKAISLAAGFGGALVLGIVLHFGAFSLLLAALGLGIGDAVGKQVGKSRARAFMAGPVAGSLRTGFEQVPAADLAALTAAA